MTRLPPGSTSKKNANVKQTNTAPTPNVTALDTVPLGALSRRSWKAAAMALPISTAPTIASRNSTRYSSGSSRGFQSRPMTGRLSRVR